MGGDEIVAEWLGDIYSNAYTTTATPQRFSAVSLRFRSVSVYNYSGSNALYIGKYYVTRTEFLAKCHILPVFGTIEYEFVDLYELGFAHGDTATTAKLIGINEY